MREPGGTSVGEQIRSVLLDPSSTMTLRCEMMLYMASHAQLVEEIVARRWPGTSCHRGQVSTSTFAYQGRQRAQR